MSDKKPYNSNEFLTIWILGGFILTAIIGPEHATLAFGITAAAGFIKCEYLR